MIFLRVSIKKLITVLLVLAAVVFTIAYSQVKIEKDVNGETLKAGIKINFLIPMRHVALDKKIEVIPEIPKTKVHFKSEWVNSSTINIELEQKGYPQGQLLKFKVKGIPTVIPWISKTAEGEFRARVVPELISQNLTVPTRGPLVLSFNTMIKPDSLKKCIVFPVPGQLKPARFAKNGKSYTDYSRWEYFPDKSLRSNAKYQILIKPGIRSLGGKVSPKEQVLRFKTAKTPRVTKTTPKKDAAGVKLYQPVEIIFDQDMGKVSVAVTDPDKEVIIPGEMDITGRKAVFNPHRAFLPGKLYRVSIKGESKNHEPLPEHQFSFTTVDIGDKYWVDVRLGKIHLVRVYKGSKLIRLMLASGGKSSTPTPLGSFYTQDRGHSFYSPRFGEGATYWVRLIGQILVHSVPKDSQWRSKDEEHAKLGLPASHGCIRLDEKDAKWFYENIPTGTLVIIHQ